MGILGGGRGTATTVRNELRKIVDELPEEELLELRQFVDDLKSGTETEEPVNAESLAAILEGLEDIKVGWEQVKSENAI